MRTIGYDDLKIEIDPGTWETNVRETATFDLGEAADEAVKAVFEYSSPENWASASLTFSPEERFYLESQPGIWRAGRFEPMAPQLARELWARGESTELREHCQWGTNWGSPPSSAIVILTIASYRRTSREFSYDFSLHHCPMYDFGSRKSSRILDVDDGHFRAFVQGRTLTVSASKRLHFTAPKNEDRDLANLLNLLAPALTGALMKKLVFEGTSRILQAVHAQARPSPARPMPPRGGRAHAG